MIAIVTEDNEGHYAVSVRAYAPDGRELMMAFGTWGESQYQSLKEAQQAADEELGGLLRRVVGHECSSSCEQWPRSLTH
jgi:hypothetical protein